MVHLQAVVTLVAALAIIIVSCEIFTNGIEWLGLRFGLAEAATGSVLAAVGTAMPETIVPAIAIFLGSAEQGHEIGKGAILGAPFMLGTLAMFVGGVAVWVGFKRGTRKDRLILRREHAERDLRYFVVMYSVALAAGLLGMQTYFDAGYVKYALAAALLVAYVIYLRGTLRGDPEKGEDPRRALYLCRVCDVNPAKGRFSMALISLQVIAALVGIIIGAKFFVGAVETVSEAAGVPPIILAFLIAPVATELPEKSNSVIWYLRSKDVLGFGNITGAMVFQSSIPVSIGLLFTEWELGAINIASIVIALAASAWLLFRIRYNKGISYRVMLASGSLYILYIVLLVVIGPS